MDRKWPIPFDGSGASGGSADADLPALLNRLSRGITLPSLFLFLLALLWPADALAEVLVQDRVSPVGQEIMLRAETKSGFFSKGGALVEFFVDGKSSGKKLSGGDGVAYLPLVPARTGLHKIRAQSDDEQDEGLLLVVQRSTQLALIDVEGSLREPSSFALKPRSGSVAAVKKINRKYPVVFLWTAFIGLGAAKAWLKESGFPEAPLLAWDRGEAFRELGERHLKIRVVVGSAEVVQSAREYTSRTVSFEAVGDREAVQDWEEIVKRVE